MRPGPRNLITDVPGIAVGNAEAAEWGSGTTVLLPDAPVMASVDVRGGGPGTRETDALLPEAMGERVDALVLSGGSAYGLDAAGAVMEWLRDRGRGLSVAGALVPIVPAAILFDLPRGADPSRPNAALPYRRLGAEAVAAAGPDFALGNAGAGLGATTADLKGGLGSASILWERPGLPPISIGALVAVNALGSVLMPGTRCFLAAPWEIGAEFGATPMPPRAPQPTAVPTKRPATPGTNTTIAVVATDAALTKAEARRLAIMAQDGIARAIQPAHTPFDGDTVFAVSTGAVPLTGGTTDLYQIGSLAALCLSRAIARGVHAAEPLFGMPAWRS